MLTERHIDHFHAYHNRYACYAMIVLLGALTPICLLFPFLLPIMPMVGLGAVFVGFRGHEVTYRYRVSLSRDFSSRDQVESLLRFMSQNGIVRPNWAAIENFSDHVLLGFIYAEDAALVRLKF